MKTPEVLDIISVVGAVLELACLVALTVAMVWVIIAVLPRMVQ